MLLQLWTFLLSAVYAEFTARFLFLLSYDLLIFFTIMEVKVIYLQLHVFWLKKKNQWEKISISDSHTSCVCGKRAHVNILVMSNINNETSHFKTGLSLKRSSFIVLLWLIILRVFFFYCRKKPHSFIVNIKINVFVCEYLTPNSIPHCLFANMDLSKEVWPTIQNL